MIFQIGNSNLTNKLLSDMKAYCDGYPEYLKSDRVQDQMKSFPELIYCF